MSTITITDLAQELDTDIETIEVYVGQLVDIDGEDAVIASTDDIVNGSGRVIGQLVTLTATAADEVREALAADSMIPDYAAEQAEQAKEDEAISQLRAARRFSEAANQDLVDAIKSAAGVLSERRIVAESGRARKTVRKILGKSS